ncbi:flavin reductase family protein [Saccharopolyspora pogona]|uniref:flavin reductase family protein n=1 Tax=Saccharopolyspora pogona TaxID=333966 RepID=UPI00295B25EB|nr:flavin reductase family protein [Saccharopolyspora pogona]
MTPGGLQRRRLRVGAAVTMTSEARPDASSLGAATPEALRDAFASFPSGVVAVCASVDGRAVGMAASSFCVGVSMSPPLVLVSVQHTSKSWPLLRRASRVGVSVLGVEQAEVCMRLADSSAEKFVGVDIHTTSSDSVFIDEAPVWLDCAVVDEIPVGDHDIVLLRVESLRAAADSEPLLYHRRTFRHLSD